VSGGGSGSERKRGTDSDRVPGTQVRAGIEQQVALIAKGEQAKQHVVELTLALFLEKYLILLHLPLRGALFAYILYGCIHVYTHTHILCALSLTLSLSLSLLSLSLSLSLFHEVPYIYICMYIYV
jgi:hypothetical protein